MLSAILWSEPADAPLIWIMCPATRYMTECRGLSEKHALLEICRHPTSTAEVILQPGFLVRGWPPRDSA